MSRRPTVQEIAIHEAGHAVIARVLGVRTLHIELCPDGKEYCGQCNYAPDRPSDLDSATASYAGTAAERRINPSATLHGTDKTNFERRAKPVMRDYVMRRAETLVAAHWDEIEKLAAELVRCDGLYTDELEKLGYYWPPPKREPSALQRVLSGSRRLPSDT